MKQGSQPLKEKQQPSSSHQHNPSSIFLIQPKSTLFRLVYNAYKYGTILAFIILVVFAGINILGDTSIEVEGNRRIFDVYKASENFTSQVDRIKLLFEKQSSKYVSNNLVNLYSDDEDTEKTEETEKSDEQFDDLIHFSQFLVSQRYEGKNVLYLPLNLDDNKGNQIFVESYLSKILKLSRRTVYKLLENYKIVQPESVKQLKWSRIRKLIENGKVDEFLQLVSDNLVDGLWTWVKSSPQVIVLTVNQEQKVEQISTKVKKSLNKWIRQNDESSEIMILSRYPINKMYNVKEEDHLKSYQVKEVSLENINNTQLCNYLSKQTNIKQQNCQSLKSRFSKLGELQQFVKSQSKVVPTQDQSQECAKLLDEVCSNGHVKHFFYENQQNVNKVLTKNKSKKNRSDRELQALILKWSHLKKQLGLNKIKDIFLTLISGNGEEGKQRMSLRDMNEKGLIYDFDLHELKWRSEKERLEYEIRNDKICKNGKVVIEEMVEEVRVNKEQQQARQKQVQQQQQEVQQQEQEVKQQQQQQKVQEKQQQVNQQQQVDNKQQQQVIEQKQSQVQTQDQVQISGQDEKVEKEEEESNYIVEIDINQVNFNKDQQQDQQKQNPQRQKQEQLNEQQQDQSNQQEGDEYQDEKAQQNEQNDQQTPQDQQQQSQQQDQNDQQQQQSNQNNQQQDDEVNEQNSNQNQ